MRIPVALALLACLAAGEPAKSPWSWLLEARLPRGGWPAVGDGPMHAGATSLAVLPLLSFGFADRPELPHHAALHEGLGALLVAQDEDGRLGDETEHALGTLALAEATWRTKETRYRLAAWRALVHLRRLQRDDGSFGDVVTTGWAGLALASAIHAGFSVPRRTLAALERWIDGVPAPSPRAAAVATLLRIVLKGDKAAIDRGVAACLEHLPARGEADEVRWCFATLALHARGGIAWRKWSEAMKGAIVEARAPDGTWDPSPHAPYGRLGATALMLLCLETYYRADPT